MLVYRVVGIEGVILFETTLYTAALRVATAQLYATIHTRKEHVGGPAYDGRNFGKMAWVSCREFSSPYSTW